MLVQLYDMSKLDHYYKRKVRHRNIVAIQLGTNRCWYDNDDNVQLIHRDGGNNKENKKNASIVDFAMNVIDRNTLNKVTIH